MQEINLWWLKSAKIFWMRTPQPSGTRKVLPFAEIPITQFNRFLFLGSHLQICKFSCFGIPSTALDNL
jgi:hypothetical protein